MNRLSGLLSGRANVVMVAAGLDRYPILSINLMAEYNGLQQFEDRIKRDMFGLCQISHRIQNQGQRCDPGNTATDFNSHSGYRMVQQAAAGIPWLAAKDGSGPTAGFFFEDSRVPW